jgi:hypothetical protein
LPAWWRGSRSGLAFTRTIQKLLIEIGEACSAYQDKAMGNLPCKRIQCDEIWSFCGAKEKNASPEKKREGWGDCLTWTGFAPTQN